MINLKTTYMGVELKNPIIVGASELTSNMDKIKQIEKAGAGAIVIKSLFEEQVQLESLKLQRDLSKYDELHAEMVTIFPKLKHAGADEHLMWARKTKEQVTIPVFASLNAVNKNTWLEYAKKLEETGVDGLELNFYATPSDFEKNGYEIEDEQLDILQTVKKNVSLPVTVKLSSFYTNPLNFVHRLDKASVDGVVLFNQFFQPDIDIHSETSTCPMNLSNSKDHRLALRFMGLLYENIRGSICASTGIFQGADVIKMLLAGAHCVQVVGTLYQNKIAHLSTMLNDIEKWMNEKGYASLDQFIGKLSQKNCSDPWMYKRAQYVKLLMQGNPLD